MGLLEKRAVKAFQDGSYKKLTDEINTLAGYPIEFEVKWDTLSVDEYSHMYEDGFTKVYFLPVIAAFKEIVSDEMGKEALKETLKKIIIKNEGQIYYGSYAYSISDGVLTIDHQPCTNIDDVTDRTKELTNLLMKQM
jgi:hypothetical protein